MQNFFNLNHELFKPLASCNTALYKIALESLYQRLISDHEFEDECTPVEAKETIRIGLLNSAYSNEWQDDVLDADIVLETDFSTRIYNRLRDTGWLLEMDDIGYRRICSFSQIGGKLLSVLLSLGQQNSFDIGSVCQGVYTNLQAIHDNPKENVANVRFCATTANSFYQEVTTLSATTREIAYQILNETDNRARMATFFNNFMKEVFEQDYSALHSKDNPYRYRNEIITLVDVISISSRRLDILVDGLLLQSPDLTRDAALARLRADLALIRKVFSHIHKIIEGMEKYRRSMARRMNEAIRYSYRATADIGQRIGSLVTALSQLEDSLDPAFIIEDNYLCVDRLFEPRQKGESAKATSVPEAPVPIEQIALDRALDHYLRRRSVNPKRLHRYIEQAMQSQISITSDDLPINHLDDLLAFVELRSLINYSSHQNCPYRQFLRCFRISLVPGETTQNAYMTAPKLLLSRKETI